MCPTQTRHYDEKKLAHTHDTKATQAFDTLDSLTLCMGRCRMGTSLVSLGWSR